MKTKTISILIIYLIYLLILPKGVIGEMESGEEMDTKENYFGYEIDDLSKLKDCLIEEYDINELADFFKGRNGNEHFEEKENCSLSISAVNQQFPIRIMRSKHYTVYKVKQGGYLYVFWLSTMIPPDNQSYIAGKTVYDDSWVLGEPTVYFSVYLSEPVNKKDFSCLIPDKSTLSDVRRIDPALEINPLQSHGIHSYSLISDEEIIDIEYYWAQTFDAMIIKTIKVKDRNSSNSCYSGLLFEDILQTFA